jgi:AraC-like DNA-binding protein
VPRWNYVHFEGSGVVEYASWTGVSGAPLCPHFHDELQLTLVLSGTRIFRVGGYELRAGAGECVVIPSGSPHRATTPPGVSSSGVNLYVTGAQHVSAPFTVRLDVAKRTHTQVNLQGQISAILRAAKLDVGIAEGPADAERYLLAEALRGTERLAEIARRLGESREHFSRRFRRLFNMSPHRYRTVNRLNLGRRRLREGDAITAVAADLGFADQSHFTRLFRATFGTTPGNYRKGQ